MEEKSFLWLSRLLAAGKVRLNLLETVFFNAEAVEAWISTDETGTIRKHNPGEESLNSYTDALDFFLSRLKSTAAKVTSSTAVCCSMWKGVRTILDVTQIEESLSRKDAFARCSALQEYKLPRSSRVLSYIYTAKYVHTQGYSTSVLRCLETHREREASTRLLHKLRDFAQIVLSAVERVKLKRVMDLELELLQDEEGSLWLITCRRCRVAVPALCRLKRTLLPMDLFEPTKRIKDQLSKQKTKTYEKGDDSIHTALQQHRYVFKRGQLRNQNSNLNSPIRLHSPLSSQTGSQSDSLLVEAQSPRSPYSPRSVKTDRLNTNFQELLLLTYSKRKGLHKKNIEDFQHYLESVLQPDLEPVKPRLSVWKPDFVFTARPSLSITSDSEDSSQPSPVAKLEPPSALRSVQRLVRRSFKPEVRSQLPSPAVRKPRLLPKNRTLEDLDVQLERLQPLLTPVLRSKRRVKIA